MVWAVEIRLDKLCLAVRDEAVVRALARRFAGPFKVVAATVGLYPHQDGVRVRGLPGRYWVYIRLVDEKDEPVYDVALWKALQLPEVRAALTAAGAIVEEQRRETREPEPA